MRQSVDEKINKVLKDLGEIKTPFGTMQGNMAVILSD